MKKRLSKPRKPRPAVLQAWREKTPNLLELFEKRVRWFGLTAVWFTLATLFWGLWRGTKRTLAEPPGQEPRMLHTPIFYLIATMGYLGLCYRLWRPLPWLLSHRLRTSSMIWGSLFYFWGLALVLSGRLTLAHMYNVSSSFGARLFTNHQLITHGPYARIRHPMYLGVLFVSVGGLLLYRTWTFVFLLLQFPALVVRSRKEERALARLFGEDWTNYAKRVPAWIPKFNFTELGI